MEFKVTTSFTENNHNTTEFLTIKEIDENISIPSYIDKNFKETDYVTIDKSIPVSKHTLEYLQKTSFNKENTFLEVYDINTKIIFKVYCIDDTWYHDKVFNNKKIVLYKSMQNNEIICTIDKNKYANLK